MNNEMQRISRCAHEFVHSSPSGTSTNQRHSLQVIQVTIDSWVNFFVLLCVAATIRVNPLAKNFVSSEPRMHLHSSEVKRRRATGANSLSESDSGSESSLLAKYIKTQICLH